MAKSPQGTPNELYRRAILLSLVELGGKDKCGKVLDHVGYLLRDSFTEVDLEHESEGNGMLRWRKKTQWVRVKLKKEGLLKSNSQNGVWEISEEGRRYLIVGSE